MTEIAVFTVMDGDKAVAQVAGRRDLLEQKWAKRGLSLVEGIQELTPPHREEEAAMARIKQRRNQLVQEASWAISEASPLTARSKAKWLKYIKDLHAVTRNVTKPEQVQWPEPPAELEYE